jgi:RND family efflux transporter MFP subunit
MSDPTKKMVLTIVLLAVGMWACGEKIAPGETAGKDAPRVAAPVATAAVTQQPVFYEAVAAISARTSGTVAAKLMGAVLAVHMHEGDAVKQGDLLATLDARRVEAQSDQAQAGLKEARRGEASAVSARDAARASAQLAAATYRRYQQLRKENSVSAQEFEEVQARHRQAQAAVAQSEAMLEAARSRIAQAQAALREMTVARKDAEVRSPYNGIVTAKMIDVGDLASPGTPLFTIEQEGIYCADLVLPEGYIQSVRPGLTVAVEIPALNHLRQSATVGRVVPAADAQSRSFEVKVALPPTPGVKSGMFARVRIPLGEAGLLTLPRTAIVEQGQLNLVYVVDDGGIAHPRLVRIGKSYGERVEIVSGLAPGQRYVSSVPPQLAAGMQVEAAR